MEKLYLSTLYDQSLRVRFPVARHVTNWGSRVDTPQLAAGLFIHEFQLPYLALTEQRAQTRGLRPFEKITISNAIFAE